MAQKFGPTVSHETPTFVFSKKKSSFFVFLFFCFFGSFFFETSPMFDKLKLFDKQKPEHITVFRYVKILRGCIVASLVTLWTVFSPERQQYTP